MKLTGNTILITGGATGIGLALAQRLLRAGNEVIVTGRRVAMLERAVAANAGLRAMPLDVRDAAGVAAFGARVVAEYPALNVVIHNAGVMQTEDVWAPDLAVAEAAVETNLLGPIRLTAALLPHLRQQRDAVIVNVTSGLASVPLAVAPTYSATKAAMHSYSQSLRYQLRESGIQVLELAPPYVQTELMGPGQAADPRAMPLEEFADEVMTLLAAPPAHGEILVERVKPLRFAESQGQYDGVFGELNGAFGH